MVDGARQAIFFNLIETVAALPAPPAGFVNFVGIEVAQA
jgi:hypothetical protein